MEKVANRKTGSGHGKPLSVVNQLRTDLSVMMAHINKTVPHFVCCITPVDRDMKENTQDMQAQSGVIPFKENRVAEQLRYGGILEAVKVARSALPHRLLYVDFFHRYRWIANNSHEAAAGLVKYLDSKGGAESEAKLQCVLLIQTLTVPATGAGGGPPTVAALEVQIANELTVWGMSRKCRVHEWMSSIGQVVAEKSVKLGHSKVFMDSHAHTVLEMCLSNQLALCRSKIGGLVLQRILFRRFKAQQKAVQLLLRVARGMLARRRVRRLRSALREALRQAQKGPVVERPVENVSKLTLEVREVKRQDAAVQEQITKLISNTKAPAQTTARLDFPSAKKELKGLSSVFQSGNALGPKVVDVSESIREGYLLLRPEKLTSQSTFSKMTMGKGENKVTAAVKAASKEVTKDHGLFKSFFKVMDRLRELFEIARLEKDALEGMKKGSAGTGKNENSEELDARLAALERIAKLSRSVYQYYHHYILKVFYTYPLTSTPACKDSTTILILVSVSDFPPSPLLLHSSYTPLTPLLLLLLLLRLHCILH